VIIVKGSICFGSGYRSLCKTKGAVTDRESRVEPSDHTKVTASRTVTRRVFPHLERETGIEPATLCLEGLGSSIRI
jgi:hypothetical protein